MADYDRVLGGTDAVDPGPIAMPNATIVMGVVLIGIGCWGYFDGEPINKTPIIPAVFGMFLVLLGVVGRAAHHRKNLMHVAAMTGLFAIIWALAKSLPMLSLFFVAELERPHDLATYLMAAGASFLHLVLSAKFLIFGRKRNKNHLWYAD